MTLQKIDVQLDDVIFIEIVDCYARHSRLNCDTWDFFKVNIFISAKLVHFQNFYVIEILFASHRILKFRICLRKNSRNEIEKQRS